MDKIGKILRDRQSDIARAMPAVVPPAPRLNPSQVRQSMPQVRQALQQAPVPQQISRGLRSGQPVNRSSGISQPPASLKLAAPQLNAFSALMQARPEKTANLRQYALDQTRSFQQDTTQESPFPEYPEGDTSWGVYQLPSGEMVAMPTAWATGLPEGSSQHGETLTDPGAIDRARESDIAFLNQPPEVQEQIAIPGMEPENNSTTPLWIGDDQARQQEELTNEGLGNELVAQGYRQKLQHAKPVTIGSDQARERELLANQGLSDEMVAGAGRLQQMYKGGQAPVSIASDIARQQAEQQVEQQTNNRLRTPVMGMKAPPVVEINGLLYPQQTESPTQYQYLGPNQNNLPEAPDGYMWVFYPPDQYSAGGPASLIPVDADLPNGAVPAQLDPNDSPDYQDMWNAVGEWAEEDVVPIFNQYVESITPIVNQFRMGKLAGDGPDTVEESVEGISALPKMTIQLLDTTGATEKVAAEISEQLPQVLDALKAGWNAADLERFSSYRKIRDVLTAEIPGLDMSAIDVMVLFLTKPQDYTIEQSINAWYYETTGTDNRDEGNTGLLGKVMGGLGSVAMMTTDFPQWIEANEQEALSAYENGVDSNGDGVVDLTGPDAVQWLYLEQASPLMSFWFQTATDPYSWAALVGKIGTVGARIGRGLKMGETAGPLRRAVGTGIEKTGETIHKLARITEEAGDLGLGVALEGGFKLAKKAGAVVPHASAAGGADFSARERELARALNSADRVDPTATVGPTGVITPGTPGSATPGGAPGTPGTPPTPAASGVVPTPPPPSPSGVPSITQSTIVAPPPASAVVPPGTPTPPSPGGVPRIPQTITTPPSSVGVITTPPPTAATPGATGTATVAGDVVKFDDGPSVPVRWTPSPDPSQGTRAIDRIYQKVGERRWAPVRAEMADTWIASEASLAKQGRGAARTQMAIESSAVARDTIDSMIRHGIYDAEDWVYNIVSGAENPYYRALEEVIRLPWSETAAQRKFLSVQGPSGWVINGTNLEGKYPFIRMELLGDYPTAKQIEMANNFVNLMEQHVYWNPEAFNNPEFLVRWQKAVDLDTQLRANNLRSITGDGIYANAGRALADMDATKNAGITPSPAADDPIELGKPKAATKAAATATPAATVTPPATPATPAAAATPPTPTATATPAASTAAPAAATPSTSPLDGGKISDEVTTMPSGEEYRHIVYDDGEQVWIFENRTVTQKPDGTITIALDIDSPNYPKNKNVQVSKAYVQEMPKSMSIEEALSRNAPSPDKFLPLSRGQRPAATATPAAATPPTTTTTVAAVDATGTTAPPRTATVTTTTGESVPAADKWQRTLQDFDDSTELVDEFHDEDLSQFTYGSIENPDLTIVVETIPYSEVDVQWRREFPNHKGRGKWWVSTYKHPDGNGTAFYAPSPEQAATMSLNESRANGIPPIPEDFKGVNPAEVMGQDTAGTMEVPNNLTQVATTSEVQATRKGAPPEEKRTNTRLKRQMKFPQKVGDTTVWAVSDETPVENRITIEKVYEKNGVTGYIGKTAGGDVGFVSETVARGKYKSVRWFPVEVEPLRAGTVQKIEMSLPYQNTDGLTQVQIAQILHGRNTPTAPVAEAPPITPDEGEPVADGVPDVEEEPAIPEVADELPTEPESEASVDDGVAEDLAPEDGEAGTDLDTIPDDTEVPTTGEDVGTGDTVTATTEGTESLEPAPEDTGPEAKSTVTPTNDTFYIDPDDLILDETNFQTRTETNQQWVDTLAANWKGESSPAINVVELTPGKFTVVSGHHRTLAARKAKKLGNGSRVRIRVIEADNLEDAIAKGVEDSVVSNVPGLAPNPLDDARAIQILKSRGHTVKDGKLGPFSRADVANSEKLLRLPETLQGELRQNYQQIPRDIHNNVITPGWKDSRKMNTRKAVQIVRAIDEGVWTPDEAVDFWINGPEDITLGTITDFESFVDMLVEHKGLYVEAKGKQQQLFSLKGDETGSFDPIYQTFAELGKLRKKTAKEAGTLKKASDITSNESVSTSLKSEAVSIEQIHADAEQALKNVIRDQNREINRYSQTTDGQRTVKMGGGDQIMMDVGTANKPEMAGAVEGGAVDENDLLGGQEKTPEQIRQEQLAAGQTDMFSMSEPERQVIQHANTVGDANNSGIIASPQVIKSLTDDVDVPTKKVMDPTGKVEMEVPETPQSRESTATKELNDHLAAAPKNMAREDIETVRRHVDDMIGPRVEPVDTWIDFVNKNWSDETRAWLDDVDIKASSLRDARSAYKGRVVYGSPDTATAPDASDATIPVENITQYAKYDNGIVAETHTNGVRLTGPNGTVMDVFSEVNADGKVVYGVRTSSGFDSGKRQTRAAATKSALDAIAGADKLTPNPKMTYRGKNPPAGATKAPTKAATTGPLGPGVGTYATLPGIPWMSSKLKGAMAVRSGPMPLARTNAVSIDTGTAYWAVGRKVISSPEFKGLTRHKWANNDTLLDRIDSYYHQFKSNPAVWHDDALLLASRKALEDYKVLLETEIYPPGVIGQQLKANIRKLPPARVAYDAAEKILKGLIKGLDVGSQYFRERMLFGHFKGPAYVETQMLGNSAILFIGGEWGALLKYWNLRDGWNGARKTLKESMDHKANLRKMTELDKAKAQFHIDPGVSASSKLQERLGSKRGKYELEVYQGFGNEIDDPLMVTKALTSVNRHLGGLGKLSGSKKYAQWGALWDGTMRDVLSYTHTLKRLRHDVIPDYKNQTINRLVDWGIPKADAIQHWNDFIDTTDGVWNMDQVIDHFEKIPGVGAGKAQALGRDWQKAINETEQYVDGVLRKKSFAGDETRADLVLKRAFIFHHFMSRQSWFLLSQATHHPFLINMYFNMQEELEKLSEDWPPYMQNWVKFLGFGGMSLFLNPVSLAASFVTFTDQGQTWMPDQMTEIGGYVKQIQGVLGINPLIAQSLNLLGVMGDDQVPDPLMIWREDRAVTTALNWARYFGFGSDQTPLASPYKQLMADTRETLSDWNPFLDDPVLANDQQGEVDRDVRILMIDEAKKRGLDLTDPAVQETMNDPESDLYQKALERYLKGETLKIASDYALGAFRPRVLQTNEEGQPIYANLTRDEKDLANTTDPRAQDLKSQQDQYHAIGTDIEQGVNQVWTDVAYGTVQYPVTVGGRTYSVEEQRAMSQDERKALATALVQDYGYTEELDTFRTERSEFLADPENAEYAQYDTWAGEVRDNDKYPSIDAYWQELIKVNPNAARYYESVMSTVQGRGNADKNLTSMGAFMAIKGYTPNVFAPIPTVTDMYTGGVADPLNIANQPAQPQAIPESSNAEYENEVKKAPEYLQDLEEWDAAVAEKQAELGYGTTPFDQLPGGQRKEVEDALEEEKVYEPDPSWQVADYIEWAEKQPAGKDTSIDAYLDFNEREYRAGAITRFEEMLGAPPPLSTSDSAVWDQLLALLNEHDRSRYPE